MSAIFKLLIVFALSSVKFILAPPLSFGMGLNYFQTIISTSLGGILGVVLFFYLSRSIISLYDVYCRPAVHRIIHLIAIKLNLLHLAEQYFPIKRRIRVFTYTNRLIVKIRRKYGFVGIVALTPVLLSIPLGSFLVARFYPKKKYVVLYLSASVVFWSLLMSSAIAVF